MDLILPDPLLPFEKQAPIVLLACAIFGEARGECTEAKLAVGCVIENRVKVQPRYGIGLAGVILHPYAFSSFLASDPNRGKMLNPCKCEAEQVWSDCYDAAAKVFYGKAVDATQRSTHYHDASIPTPHLWCHMTPTVKIGRLSFFREG